MAEGTAELAEMAVGVFSSIISEESLVVVKCTAHTTTAEVMAINVRCRLQLPKLCHPSSRSSCCARPCRCTNTHVATVLRVGR